MRVITNPEECGAYNGNNRCIFLAHNQDGYGCKHGDADSGMIEGAYLAGELTEKATYNPDNPDYQDSSYPRCQRLG